MGAGRDDDAVGRRLYAPTRNPMRACFPVSAEPGMGLIGQHFHKDRVGGQFGHRPCRFQAFDAERRVVVVQADRAGLSFRGAHVGRPIGYPVHIVRGRDALAGLLETGRVPIA